MPQLDKASFIAQLIYFFSIFFLLWLGMSKIFLPSLGKTLKLRKAIFEGEQQTLKENEGEEQNIENTYINFQEKSPFETKLVGKEHILYNAQKIKKELLKRNFLKKLLTNKK